MGAFRRSLVWAFRRINNLFFREIEVIGDVPEGAAQGRIVVSNHVNGIIDAILILTTAQCELSPVAKSTLWNVPGFRWLLDAVDAVRIVRRVDDPSKSSGSNAATFEHAAAWLRGGNNLLIFPEGTSHSEPHLVELKSGAARMLLGARGEEKGVKLSIQSVALTFDAREDFRSRALLMYGPVRDLTDLPEQGEAFVTSVTKRIKEDLSTMLVEAATWEEHRLISLIGEMIAHDRSDDSMAGLYAAGRRVKSAYSALADDPPALEELRRKVFAYEEELREAGLSDADIAGPTPREVAGALRKALLLATLPFALAGVVLYTVPYGLVAFFSSRVTSGDEVSTIKLGVALLAFPIWALLLLILTFECAPPEFVAPICALLVLSPFCAVYFRDAAKVFWRSLRKALLGDRLKAVKAARAEAIEHARSVMAL